MRSAATTLAFGMKAEHISNSPESWQSEAIRFLSELEVGSSGAIDKLAAPAFLRRAQPVVTTPSYLMKDWESADKSEVDLHARSAMDVLESLRGAGLNASDESRYVSAASLYLPALLGAIPNAAALSVLQVGRNSFVKAIALSRAFRSFIAVEANHGAAKAAERWRGAADIPQLQIIADDPLRAVEDVRGVDVLIVYSLFHHLTLGEGQALFAAMRQVREAGGFVVIADTPNRLFPYDAASGIEFFRSLPSDLAGEYASLVGRESVRRKFDAAKEKDVALLNLGRGVSYHEFELWFPPVAPSSFQLSGYNNLMLNIEPLASQEATLARYMQERGLPVDPLFSRSLLNFVSGPGELNRETHLVEPSVMRGCQVSGGNLPSRKRWVTMQNVTDLVEFALGPEAGGGELSITIDLSKSHGEFLATRRDGSVIRHMSVDALKASVPRRWHPLVSFAVAIDDEAIRLCLLSGSKLVTSTGVASLKFRSR